MGMAMSLLSQRAQLNLAENLLPRPSASVARKVRDYIVKMAYLRFPGNIKDVWNALWSEDSSKCN